jgi:hypothetical protein
MRLLYTRNWLGKGIVVKWGETSPDFTDIVLHNEGII